MQPGEESLKPDSRGRVTPGRQNSRFESESPPLESWWVSEVRLRIEARPAPFPSTGQFFPVSQIAKARFFDNSLVVLTTGTHPAPGRYALRYGKAITRRDRITAALTALIEPS